MLRPLTSRFRELFGDLSIATGAAIVIFSVGVVVLILVTAVPVGNPYIGLFTFIFLPIMVVTGGAIFLLGVLVVKPGKGETLRQRGLKGFLKAAFTIDLKKPRQRRRLTFFLVAGVIEVLVLSVGGLALAEFMDTPTFCGETCHTVMSPEYTVYQRSPHARVSCVNCHIGPGASWLVKSKINGVRQVFAVLLGTYEHPISSPVDELRPARETCEVCHWPERFSGDLTHTYRHYEEDEMNTEKTTTLVLKVGGGESEEAAGIHWHIGANVWYLPLDEKRQEIGWVGAVDEEGKMTQYYDKERISEITPERIGAEKRLMDCIDCHNRATHIFYSPEELLDQALARDKIDPSLPFIKKKGLELLVEANPAQSPADIQNLERFYRDNYPQIYLDKRPELDRAMEELKELVKLVSFPEMEVNWTTHPNNLGHQNSPGCFRCHGELTLLTGEGEGKAISGDCNLCHSFLAP